MDDAPWFDAPDQFDPAPHPAGRHRRLGRDRHHLPRTRRRAALLQPVRQRLERRRPARRASRRSTTSPSSRATDLLGNGTACLVWSSPLPGDARRPMRYVDLMGGQKPHLLVSVENNLGAETRVRVRARRRASTCEDKLAGGPGSRGCRFPVHVVERVETFDRHQPQSLRHALRLSPRLLRRRRARVPRLRHGRAVGHRRVRRAQRRSATLAARPTSTRHRTCRRCSRGPGSTPASISAATASRTSSPDCSMTRTRASTTASRD